ncbi:MAG: lipid A biosynthesis acyltransferase [Flavihumibacter sp.]|nr:lipid A biosynthesis acyltransferase [Flavihumibacter sp.]
MQVVSLLAMYYIVYGFLYLLSLLPFWVLHGISSLVYFFLYRVFGYRKKVVMANLLLAFPEKTEAERDAIAAKFYQHLCDTFLETIKLLSISGKELKRRFEVNEEGLEAAYAANKVVYVYGMHNFNWELAQQGISQIARYPYVAIYMPLSNAVMERLIKKLRGRFGSILIPATDFKTHYLKYNKDPHMLISGFDQSPGTGDKAYWMQFFNHPTGFVKGGEKGARINRAAVVFLHFYPKRRGYYKLETHFVTADARSLEDGALTLQYARYIETCVRHQPANYLWSHRRWKLPWKPEYKELWIDEKALPPAEGAQ